MLQLTVQSDGIVLTDSSLDDALILLRLAYERCAGPSDCLLHKEYTAYLACCKQDNLTFLMPLDATGTSGQRRPYGQGGHVC